MASAVHRSGYAVAGRGAWALEWVATSGAAQRGGLPEGFLVHVRDVYHDAAAVAGADQRLAGRRQAGAGIGEPGTAR